MTPVATNQRVSASTSRTPAGHHRPELQGLRALAVILVVVYHVWLGRVSGGVDVFFVISGFLVTGQLVRATTRGGIPFRSHFGRLLKRLVPSATVVLVAVAVAAVFLLPGNRWLQTVREITASALYAQNWQLAFDSVDYYAQNNTASVVQHFWSLSIQGQFYLVWPLLVALVAVVARRHPRRVLALTLTTITAASLAYSVHLTVVNQPYAYFHTATRVWEFGIGGLLALALARVRLDRRLRVALGWGGVVGLVGCGALMNVGAMFPGWLALWPVLSACSVILAGQTASAFGADRWLSLRPLSYVGDISYCLYLWHWPVLVFYLVVRDRVEVGLLGGLFIIALSVVLAVLTHHLVEEPVRKSGIGSVKPWGAYRMAGLMLVAVLGLAQVWQHVAVRQADRFAGMVGDQDHPGAVAHVLGYEFEGDDDAVLIPPMVTIGDDWLNTPDMTCGRRAGTRQLDVCTSTYTDTPTKRVVIVGDSHMGQLTNAFYPIAERRGWELTLLAKGACTYSTTSEQYPGDPGCLTWIDEAHEEVLRLRPDAVVTAATRDPRAGRTEVTPAGFVERWQQLRDAGITVFAIRDNPRFDYRPSDCAEVHGVDSDKCSTPRSDIFAEEPPYARVEGVPDNVYFFDFTDYYCDALTCGPVVGNVRVYMDDNHTTATFMRTLAPVVENAIVPTVGW
ncbi:acyltransferase family protein [Actinokineospora pegani]|uniref:acyltransferase family protein n=1 Tax=Actinokineospora pegani TaxID=2654637 RepID=UPI0012E9C90D|nr:acyltransferase family protein [Actinokineospora pegani]